MMVNWKVWMNWLIFKKYKDNTQLVINAKFQKDTRNIAATQLSLKFRKIILLHTFILFSLFTTNPVFWCNAKTGRYYVKQLT